MTDLDARSAQTAETRGYMLIVHAPPTTLAVGPFAHHHLAVEWGNENVPVFGWETAMVVTRQQAVDKIREARNARRRRQYAGRRHPERV